MKKYGDFAIGMLFLICTYAYYQGTFMERKFRLSAYGAEFVPRIYCVVMAITAIAIMVRAVLRMRGQDTAEAHVSWRAVGRVAATIGCIALYVYLMPKAGFLLSTALYLALQVVTLAPREKQRPVSIVLFSLIVSTSLTFLFTRVFSLALPPGVFTL